MARAVVTGGAGFVGSSLCERLLALGWQVVAVDDLSTGRMCNLSGLLDHPQFAFLHADVTQPFTIDGPVTDVLHLASPASPFDYLALPIQTLLAGSYGTFVTLELARQKGARYLLASTSEVYGDPLEHPQRESYLGNVSCTGPRSVYDEAKRFAEATTMAFHRTHGVDTRIVRIFNTYGPRMKVGDGRAVPTMLDEALRGVSLTVSGDGTQTRSFCYIDDLVEGILVVLDQGDAEPYNLGNPDEFSILALAQHIQTLAAADPARPEGTLPITFQPLPVDDPRRRKPDIARAVALGWQPRVALAEGLQRTYQGLRERSRTDSTGESR